MEMKELEKLMIGEEENLTIREENEWTWRNFVGEEEDLTDEEKKAWEVIK